MLLTVEKPPKCKPLLHNERRQWQPIPVLLPGKSHGWRSLVGYTPWGREESDTIEWLHFHFSLSCIGEGNGNPLQCSCLENPRNGGSWWAAVYGVAQSQTRLKRLSSSSISTIPSSVGWIYIYRGTSYLKGHIHIYTVWRVGALKPHIVQRSTVLIILHLEMLK